MSPPAKFFSPPPSVPHTKVTFPAPHVMLATLSRPRSLNAIPRAQHVGLAVLWEWYDREESLRCAVITGEGRAFCAGADLKEWDSNHSPDQQQKQQDQATPSWLSSGGFGGLSNRLGKKPVIAAVNGLCFGGGMEMAVNCDLILASSTLARFGLPEVKRGVIAVAGALPRLSKTLSLQRAGELALLGRTSYTAEDMRNFGIVNFVIEEHKGNDGKNGRESAVVQAAVCVAEEIAANSPDSVVASREGLRLGWEGVGPVTATRMLENGMYARMDGGENMVEGVRSFVEKREPKWVGSKL